MRRMFLSIVLVSAIVIVPHLAFSQSEATASDKPDQDAIQRFAFRSIGPASMDGRIDAFAVPRHDPALRTSGSSKCFVRATLKCSRSIRK
jgi:hypothetical protein